MSTEPQSDTHHSAPTTTPVTPVPSQMREPIVESAGVVYDGLGLRVVRT